jgi:ankyrin repeat protein
MQIFALLENSQKEDDTDDNLYSMLQLGLCYLVGFGTSVNANAGIELVDRAASKGLAKAQAVSMRLHSTLGIPISDHYQLAVRDWLRNGASLGSQVALDDLTYHFPAEVKRLGKGKEKAIIIQDPANTSVFASDSSLDTSNLGECLLLACRQDDNAVARQLIEQMGNDAVKDCRGRFGESPLHWAVYSSEGAPSALLMFLMKNNVDLHLETDSECPLSEVDNFCNTIPARTTAFEWAILKDDANLVQNLLSMDLDFIPQLHITRYICLSARYQCIKVLRYLCSIIGPDHLPPTDIYGFSAFYYAIRPDIFDRMLRLRPGDYTDRQYPPYIARQAEVIELLLKMGHTIQVHKENLFTCIHLLVSVGSTEILKIVLQDKSCRELVNVESAFGGTPLKDAIVPGNTEAFNLLMEYGANPNMVWKEKQYHALHVCAMCPGSQAVNFAKKLVARDSFCLERLDYNRSKPLHIAAEYGHQMLANFLVEKGAALLDVNSSGLTPLGMAVKARFIGLTQLLMRKHMEQKLEQIAAGRGMDWIQIKEASALKFLLTPGKFSPTQPNPLPFQRGDTRLGCFDFPFSPLSVRLLAVLLEEHREPIWTSGFQPFIFWFRATYDPYTFASGLYEAIKVGNL